MQDITLIGKVRAISENDPCKTPLSFIMRSPDIVFENPTVFAVNLSLSDAIDPKSTKLDSLYLIMFCTFDVLKDLPVARRFIPSNKLVFPAPFSPTMILKASEKHNDSCVMFLILFILKFIN